MVNHVLRKQRARARRVRAKMEGSASKPRVSVYRSNKHIYLQAIDDQAQKTVASTNDVALAASKKPGTKTERATKVAADLATVLQKQKIKAVIFDRGHYKYHGRVKAVAETLREQGITV